MAQLDQERKKWLKPVLKIILSIFTDPENPDLKQKRLNITAQALLVPIIVLLRHIQSCSRAYWQVHQYPDNKQDNPAD
ncbi:hypothetical protein ABID22_000514 [Pontibacter aydingkolensis]